MAIEPKTLKQLEDILRLSHPIWYRGGVALPLVFTIAEGPTFFGLNFDEFFDSSTGLIRESALPPLGSNIESHVPLLALSTEVSFSS